MPFSARTVPSTASRPFGADSDSSPASVASRPRPRRRSLSPSETTSATVARRSGPSADTGVAARHGSGLAGSAGPAPDGHIGVERRGVGARDVDQAFVDRDAALQREPLRLHAKVGIAAHHDAAVHPAQHAEAVRLHMELCARRGAEAGAAGQAQLALAAAQHEALHARVGASQRHRQLAIADIDAFEQVSHFETGADDLAGVLGRAEAAPERRGRVQLAAEPPSRRKPRGPHPQVCHAQLHHALERRVGRRPRRARVGAHALRAAEHADAGAGQRLRQVPGAIVRGQREPQVGEAERLRASVLRDGEVAVAALDDDVGIEALALRDDEAAGDGQVAAPAERRLQPREPWRDGQRLELGVELDARRGAAAPARLAPAQRGTEQLHAPRRRLRFERAAGGVEAHSRLQILRRDPGRRGAGARAHLQPLQRALPSAAVPVAAPLALAGQRQGGARRGGRRRRRWPGREADRPMPAGAAGWLQTA